MRIIVFLMSLHLIGCATVSPEAEKVQVHRQVSNLVNDCRKLGPLSAARFDSEWAIADMREQTAKLGGDTLVILSRAGSEWQGVAMKCYVK